MSVLSNIVRVSLLGGVAFQAWSALAAPEPTAYPPARQQEIRENHEPLTADGKVLISSRVVEDSGNWYCYVSSMDEHSELSDEFTCRAKNATPLIKLKPTYSGDFAVQVVFNAGPDFKEDDLAKSMVTDRGEVLEASKSLLDSKTLPHFIQAVTTAKELTVTSYDGRTWPVSLKGITEAISAISMWLKEHNIPQPAPFTPPGMAIEEFSGSSTVVAPSHWHPPFHTGFGDPTGGLWGQGLEEDYNTHTP